MVLNRVEKEGCGREPSDIHAYILTYTIHTHTHIHNTYIHAYIHRPSGRIGTLQEP